MIRKWLNLADGYLKESDWRTLAALKLCLLSLGVIIGVLLPAAAKRGALILCGAVFALTYVPLMGKLLRLAGRK